jgi:hypothetical protein
METNFERMENLKIGHEVTIIRAQLFHEEWTATRLPQGILLRGYQGSKLVTSHFIKED